MINSVLSSLNFLGVGLAQSGSMRAVSEMGAGGIGCAQSLRGVEQRGVEVRPSQPTPRRLRTRPGEELGRAEGIRDHLDEFPQKFLGNLFC